MKGEQVQALPGNPLHNLGIKTSSNIQTSSLITMAVEILGHTQTYAKLRSNNCRSAVHSSSTNISCINRTPKPIIFARVHSCCAQIKFSTTSNSHLFLCLNMSILASISMDIFPMLAQAQLATQKTFFFLWTLQHSKCHYLSARERGRGCISAT